MASFYHASHVRLLTHCSPTHVSTWKTYCLIWRLDSDPSHPMSNCLSHVVFYKRCHSLDLRSPVSPPRRPLDFGNSSMIPTAEHFAWDTRLPPIRYRPRNTLKRKSNILNWSQPTFSLLSMTAWMNAVPPKKWNFSGLPTRLSRLHLSLHQQTAHYLLSDGAAPQRTFTAACAGTRGRDRIKSPTSSRISVPGCVRHAVNSNRRFFLYERRCSLVYVNKDDKPALSPL